MTCMFFVELDARFPLDWVLGGCVRCLWAWFNGSVRVLGTTQSNNVLVLMYCMFVLVSCRCVCVFFFITFGATQWTDGSDALCLVCAYVCVFLFFSHVLWTTQSTDGPMLMLMLCRTDLCVCVCVFEVTHSLHHNWTIGSCEGGACSAIGVKG